MPSSTSTVKVYLVGPDPIGADLPGTTCQVPLPFGTKLSPGGRAAAESPLLVPDGTGPVELLCDVGATADPRTAGATARTGTVAADDAVAVVVAVVPLTVVLTVGGTTDEVSALEAGGLRTSTMTRTVRATSMGMANARQPYRWKNRPGAVRPRWTRREPAGRELPGRELPGRELAGRGVRSAGSRLGFGGCGPDCRVSPPSSQSVERPTEPGWRPWFTPVACCRGLFPEGPEGGSLPERRASFPGRVTGRRLPQPPCAQGAARPGSPRVRR